MTRASRQRARSRRRVAWLAALALSLAACGVLPEVSKPVELYTLTPKTSYANDLPEVDWQLVVEEPVAAAGIDTARIALSHSPFMLEYYANAGWTDTAPAMVQTLLVESFESTGSIVAVGREAIGLRPDYILKTDLREFQAVYDGEASIPTVIVRMNAKLVEMPERRIIASNTFERRVAAGGTAFVDVLAAFDEALGQVIKQIVVFTLRTPPPSG